MARRLVNDVKGDGTVDVLTTQKLEAVLLGALPGVTADEVSLVPRGGAFSVQIAPHSSLTPAQ
eukprot:scaffold191405_cov18-Tisochrysis_lutea.AAC.1